MVAAWPRDRYAIGGEPARIALLALSSVKLPDPLPVSRVRHGMPDDGDGAMSVTLFTRARAEDPVWFADRFLSQFADLIASDLGPSVATTALAAEHAYGIDAELEDPDDLGHLQAAWALAKCICEEGAAVVIDVNALRAHLGSDVAALAPDRAFDIMHEVSVFFDELPEGGLAAWSLGLRKFGRPDLVLLGVPPDDTTGAALVLRGLATSLADGERVEPGDEVSSPDGRVLTAVRFEAEMAPVVSLVGPAILLR